ncbi:uncharacterized protein B0H18DRAFT_26786 [Fomitopsis serialis]|uniref:uncharacterized protein n=1 Tax=Fomitopsis serialis TaxID=139415 RepID=UPI0020089604|nr:uncharacterized protein B0H18DRAFT_26786 [Neoantrodia serialis]KAH9932487.1 hypothetical protein B0H18DRAFT_26786 [Neoantrodia serialis]
MSKKGNKAQTKENKDQSYEFRDIVLAKVRGYPSWPGMIVDPETVPQNVQGERPNAKSKKGKWYCVRFFPAGDYAWIVPRDISKLQQHEIQAYVNEPAKKSADLLHGYRIALDPTEWEKERNAMRDAAAEAEANAEVDQLQSDGEEEAGDDDEEELKPKAKKRKRDSEATPAKSKAKPKTPKKGSAEPVSKKKTPTSKARKNGHKSKAMIESEDEGGAEAEDEDAGPSKQVSPPPTKKAKREKEGEEGEDSALANDPEASKVREWRHKLQKAFLNTKVVAKDEDIPAFDQLFSTVENYQNMTIQYLTFSKIGKVMRHINALPKERVPRDDEYHFKDRAKALVDKWHDILAENKGKPNGTAAAGESAKATTNGTSPTAKAPDTADADATTNGKQADKLQAEGSEAAMEIDNGESKAEDVPAGEKAESGDADAEAETNDDAPADLTADDSVLADVTMSEAA